MLKQYRVVHVRVMHDGLILYYVCRFLMVIVWSLTRSIGKVPDVFGICLLYVALAMLSAFPADEAASGGLSI